MTHSSNKSPTPKSADDETNAIAHWIHKNPGVTLSFITIAVISLSSFLFFFLGGAP